MRPIPLRNQSASAIPVWRLLVSLLASMLGAALLLHDVREKPPARLLVPLATLIQPAPAPLITIAPGPLAALPPIIEPDWDEALALATAHPAPRKLLARASTKRSAIALNPPSQPSPHVTPIGRVFAWLSSHAVRTAIPNDQMAGG